MTAPEMFLGKYRLERKLGAGGMGEVWEARDTILDRAVAIKLLTGDTADRERYVREAAAAARVSHPNTVTVHDAAEVSGRWHIVMELVRGPNAAQLVEQRGRLPWAEATRIVRDAAAGLAAVHAAGLIHRDIKPGNILLNELGQAKIADFGLARHTARTSYTTTGSLLGTPHFMSPEQCQGEPADARSDVYALGATYYALLTGHPPYDGENQMAIMFAHCNNPIPDPRTRVPDLPEGCTAIVRRAMAKQPAERFATADALRASLDDALAGRAKVAPTSAVTPRLPPATVAAPPLRARRLTRRVWLAAVPAAVAGLAGAAYFGFRHRHDEADSPPSELTLPPWTGPSDLKGPVAHLAVAPDSRTLAVAIEDRADDGKNHIDLRDRDGKSLPGWPKFGRGAEGVAFSPDSKLLAAVYRGWGRLQVWDLAANREVPVEGGEDLPLATMVSFSTDGKWLAAAAYVDPGAQIQFWRRDAQEAWRRKNSVSAAASQVWGFAFAPNTTLLAVTSGTGDVAALEVFDAESGAKVAGPNFPPRRASAGPCLAFAAKSSLLAVGSLGDVRLFGVPKWEPRGVMPIADRNSDVRVAALSADGSLLAAAQDQHILLFQAQDATPAAKLTRRATALAFSPDGQTLISGGEDGIVYMQGF